MRFSRAGCSARRRCTAGCPTHSRRHSSRVRTAALRRFSRHGVISPDTPPACWRRPQSCLGSFRCLHTSTRPRTGPSSVSPVAPPRTTASPAPTLGWRQSVLRSSSCSFGSPANIGTAVRVPRQVSRLVCRRRSAEAFVRRGRIFSWMSSPGGAGHQGRLPVHSSAAGSGRRMTANGSSRSSRSPTHGPWGRGSCPSGRERERRPAHQGREAQSDGRGWQGA